MHWGTRLSGLLILSTLPLLLAAFVYILTLSSTPPPPLPPLAEQGTACST